MADLRCFHNRRTCAFCFPKGNHTARAQRPPSKRAHCPSCGKFTKKGYSVCPPCMRRSFTAPSLPLAG